MGSVLIRVNKDTKDILDKMKAGKKVQGKNYYKRSMKYDDLIKFFIGNQKYICSLDFINSFLGGWGSYNQEPDIDKLVNAFLKYLIRVEPSVSGRYDRDKELCNNVISSLTSILKDR